MVNKKRIRAFVLKHKLWVVVLLSALIFCIGKTIKELEILSRGGEIMVDPVIESILSKWAEDEEAL